MTGSHWSHLRELPLVVERYELERLEVDASSGYERVTTHVRLLGGGFDGLGEDIGEFIDAHDALLAAGPSLPLAGAWTLETFCDHLATLDQWPEPPRHEQARRYRNWAFESAALDLALRQAGRTLHDVVGLEPRPVGFVNSLGLGDPPSIGTVGRRIERYPGLRFKLDADPAWTPALVAELAATGAVEVVDFKGQYGLKVDDLDALVALYARVLRALPNALLEDPHDYSQISALLRPHLDRVSYDAPIHEVADIEATPLSARTINVKPSRTGGIRPLLSIYAHCAEHGLRMYGGGMGELGVGRGQVQLLASLFHPDGPNDVAPTAYNATDLPDGLPSSPLAPAPEPVGFRS